MPLAGDERDRSPHPYARRAHDDKSDESSWDVKYTSESGTEADDERPQQLLKALPPPVLRPTKGLKRSSYSGHDGSATPLLTPSQLDREGRRLSQGYFDTFSLDSKPVSPQISQQEEPKQPEEDELLAARRLFEKRRRAERVRRISEGALLALISLLVISGPGVFSSLWNWHRAELLSQIAAVVVLIAIYPLRIMIFGPSESSLRRRFRVPASFDPASVLYPTFVPVLVALSLLPQYPALLLPNLILGLASLPPRLFPPASRLKDINVLHWMVSIIPLIFSENTELPSKGFPAAPYKLKAGRSPFLHPEYLAVLYPLHQAMLPSLHYLTTTSLLPAEKHLLSASLINVLFFAASPQATILQALLWIGGVWLMVFCTHVLRWNVALARVPRWRFRRTPKSKSILDWKRNGSLIMSLRRLVFPSYNDSNDESDADEDAQLRRKNGQKPEKSRLDANTSAEFIDIKEPLSAVDTSPKINAGSVPRPAASRQRRHTIASVDVPTSLFGIASFSSDQRKRRPRNWYLDLTPEGAFVHKWAYAIYIYTVVIFVVLMPVRQVISMRALGAAEPVLWALDYIFSDALMLSNATPFKSAWQQYQDRILRSLTWQDCSIRAIRAAVGASNTRLLLIAYWAAVLCVGLTTVIRLSAYIEVDTRRKVFHAIMVTMLLPSVFVDPCFCSLALGLALAIFLLLEVIRAGQVPPLGVAIGRFVAPYVDGRDLRGPMVVSHVFLLIGCAIPLWLSLAGIGRSQSGRWTGWETEDDVREIAMVAGVVCVGMGDAAASLIGRRFGRHKWPWIGGKSLEGSGAFAVAVALGLVAAKAWVRLGGWHEVNHDETRSGLDFWLLEVAKAFICGCGASFMEAVLTGANDNVVVPVALWLLVKSVGV